MGEATDRPSLPFIRFCKMQHRCSLSTLSTALSRSIQTAHPPANDDEAEEHKEFFEVTPYKVIKEIQNSLAKVARMSPSADENDATAAAPPPAASTNKNDVADGATDNQAPSSSAATATPACPICLADMEPSDATYPMLCPTRCGYNFCGDCAASLVASSKDDYQEASDGNRHVKVRLQCPQCRGDLSTTIGETLLLRKHASMMTMGYAATPDSELSAHELRIKHGGVATEAQLALAHMVYREGAAEIGVELCEKARAVVERPTVRAVLDCIDDDTGEEALEVDEHEEAVVALPIDTTLFNGLEFAMTEEEQQYVTKMMVSGDPSQLAQAAQILAGISELMMKGITPSMRCQNAAKKSEVSSASAGIPVSRGRSGGTSRNDKSSWARGAASNAGAVSRALAMAETDASRAQAKREAEIAAHRRMHPLPSRMPRHVTLNAFDPAQSPRRWGDSKCPLAFADDEWDGSIADAFARVSIGRGGKVVKGTIDKTKQKGVHNVLMAGGGSKYETHLSSPSGRVVIASSFGQAGRSGIQKGDVVTHLNGEGFIGNSDVLRALIGQIWAQEGAAGTFSLVVNAEPCTAEVSSRSMCIDAKKF